MEGNEINVTRTKPAEFKPVKVPSTVYKTMVSAIKKIPGFEGKNESIAISFEILEGAHKGVLIDGVATLLLNEKSKLFRWVNRIDPKLLPKAGEHLNVMALIGYECSVFTNSKQKTDGDGKPFEQSFVQDIVEEGHDAPSASPEAA